MDKLLVIKTLLGEFWDKIIRIERLVPREIQFPNVPGKINVGSSDKCVPGLV